MVLCIDLEIGIVCGGGVTVQQMEGNVVEIVNES